MRRSIFNVSMVLVLAALILSACGPQTTPTAVVVEKQVEVKVEVTRIVEGTPETVVITATPEVKPTALPDGSVQINGAGATFPLPVYTEWTFAYQYVDPSVAINYQGIGSGGGKKAILDNTVDFAGSDSLVKDEEYTQGVDLQMFPVLAGAVVPIYNIAFENLAQDEKPATLVLDREILVKIYNAEILKWNDPAILALNPGLDGKLPDAQITVAHRSDGSGTTEIFTKALAAFSPAWTAGAGSSVEWPVDNAGNGIGGKGNPGVAAAVQNTPNSIGYVELSYAVQNKITFADMINKAGKQVTANADSLASSMADFAGSFSEKLTTNIVDGGGEASWPISGYTYIIIHMQSMTDCLKAEKMLGFFKWALTDAAAGKRAADLGYSVLPADVQKLVLDKMATATCNGNPVMQP